MKHLKSISLGVMAAFSASIAVMNIAVQPKTISELSLQNVRAMEASAGELKCDGQNETTCTMTFPGGSGTSKGYLKYVY